MLVSRKLQETQRKTVQKEIKKTKKKHFKSVKSMKTKEKHEQGGSDNNGGNK